MSFGNVLFAMDFTPGALRAYPFAEEIACHYRGTVYVMRMVHGAGDDTLPSLDRVGLAGPAGTAADIPREVFITHGGTCARLVAFAGNSGIDLIVIGTHGWRGLNKFLQGSTAAQVGSLATKPVLTIGPKVDCRAGFKRILYPTDFLQPAVHALPYAVSLAESYGAELLVMHANDGDAAEPPVDATPKTIQFIQQHLSNFRSNDMASQVHMLVDFGPRVDAIVRHSRARHVDLIVLGVRHRNSVRARIAAHLPASTAYEVITEAPCPVLTVPLIK